MGDGEARSFGMPRGVDTRGYQFPPPGFSHFWGNERWKAFECFASRGADVFLADPPAIRSGEAGNLKNDDFPVELVWRKTYPDPQPVGMDSATRLAWYLIRTRIKFVHEF